MSTWCWTVDSYRILIGLRHCDPRVDSIPQFAITYFLPTRQRSSSTSSTISSSSFFLRMSPKEGKSLSHGCHWLHRWASPIGGAGRRAREARCNLCSWVFTQWGASPRYRPMTSSMNSSVERPLHYGGPRVVAIGGGHGLARSLGASGARCYASHITAIVSIADDGGSSGRLRDAFGIGAPGDIRRCLGALLARGLQHLGDALEYRASISKVSSKGHAFGNVMIAALRRHEVGDFVEGSRRQVCHSLAYTPSAPSFRQQAVPWSP